MLLVPAHLLPHLPALLTSDLAVAVGVSVVEVRQCSALRFLKRETTVLVGVGHCEHAPTEATAHARAGRATGHALGTLRATLSTLCIGRAANLKLGLADRPVTVGVEPREKALAGASRPRRCSRALRPGCDASIEFGARDLSIPVRVEARKALGGIAATLRTLGTLGPNLTAEGLTGLSFVLGDHTIAVGVDPDEPRLNLRGNIGPRLDLGNASSLSRSLRGCRCDSGENSGCNAAEKEGFHEMLQSNCGACLKRDGCMTLER